MFNQRFKQLVLVERKFEKSQQLALEDMKKADNDLNKIKQIDSRIQVGNTGRFNSVASIPQIGKDNAFIFTALSMKVGDTSEPVKGLRGYYIIHLLEKTPFDSTAFQGQIATLRSSLYQEKKSAALSTWITEIKDKADIEDKRYMFYGY